MRSLCLIIRQAHVFIVCFNHNVLGWLLQYTTPANAKINIVSEGLAGRTPVPASTFAVTTSPDQLSTIWVARTGPLEMRKVFTLDKTGLFITTAVTIRNIGTDVVPSIYCKSLHTFLFFCEF